MDGFMHRNANLTFVEQFKDQTKQFALRVITLFRALPQTDEARIIGKQLLRSATSMAANYRAACRARSDGEFYAQICIVVEETDETLILAGTTGSVRRLYPRKTIPPQARGR